MNGDLAQFEEPILKLRRQIEELSALEGEAAKPAEIAELQQQLTKVSTEIYANLTPWQKTLVARHPQRPYTLDFIAFLFRTSPRSTAIATSPTIPRSWPVSRGFAATPAASSAIRRGETPKRRSSATSVSRGRRDFAKRCG